MKNELVDKLKKLLPGVTTVRLLYTKKQTSECAEYTVQIGRKYLDVLYQSYYQLWNEKLQSRIRIGKPWSELRTEAWNEIHISLLESIEQHQKGQQHPAYTKPDQYEHICSGLKLNLNDNTLEVCGVVLKKRIVSKGQRKYVKSTELTKAKSKLRKKLVMGKYRTFAVDVNHFLRMEVEKSVLVLSPGNGKMSSTN